MSFHKNHDIRQLTPLASDVIGLFDCKPQRPDSIRSHFDARVILDVEFTVKLFPYTYEKYLFSIEMKIGAKRLYVVQQLRELLDRIDRREAFVFSKHFSYDPELHSMIRGNRAVIAQLIQIYHDEVMYSEVSSAYSTRSQHRKDERMLLIPPSAWEALLPLLIAAPAVQLEQDNRTYCGIQLTEETLPLQFEFDQDGISIDRPRFG